MLEGVFLVDFGVEAAQRVLAVGLADVLAEGLAQLVHGERSVVAPELADFGQLSFQHHVREDHGPLGVPPGRPVLGLPLREPERRDHEASAAVLGVGLVQDRELEDVHHLVVEHVAEFGVGARVREHHAALHEVREPLNPFGNEERAHVRLLEVVVRAVDDHRDHARHLVLKLGREILVALLGEDDGEPGDRLFLRVIEDLDVLAFSDRHSKFSY